MGYRNILIRLNLIREGEFLDDVSTLMNRFMVQRGKADVYLD
jgi:hypothetical protein